MNIYEDAIARFDEIVSKNRELLDFTDESFEVLKNAQRTISVNFSVKTSKGLKVFNGYRVQYNNALGPTKGGIRFHHEVDLDEVKALAFWMTLKNSLLELPYGGGKGGITFNPKEFDIQDIEKISREYVRQLHRDIGPMVDVPAPDVYTTPQIMGWMMDEYCKIKGEHVPGVFTGKPLSIGGSEGREYSTAMGGYYVLKEAVKVYKMKGLKIAVQGFGNAGMHLARIAFADGHKIVAVSDSKGGVYNAEGLDIAGLIKYKEDTGSVEGFPGSESVSNEELLELDVSVLVPAALANVIDQKNAANVKAKIILELANGPITKEGDTVLNSNGVIVLPDILANAGGVTVSYFEWMQNINGESWTEDEVLEKLEKRMVRAFDVLYKEYVKSKDLDFRTAAYVHAIKRVMQAEKDRGRI